MEGEGQEEELTYKRGLARRKGKKGRERMYRMRLGGGMDMLLERGGGGPMEKLGKM